MVIDAVLGLYVWVVIVSVVMSWLIAFNVINTPQPLRLPGDGRRLAADRTLAGAYSPVHPQSRRNRYFAPSSCCSASSSSGTCWRGLLSSSVSEGAFFSLRPNGVELRLRVAPRASREGIEGIREDAQGAPVLRVAVNAPPEGGKANAAVAKLLAKTFRVAKSCVFGQVRCCGPRQDHLHRGRTGRPCRSADALEGGISSMTAAIIDGKAFAANLRQRVAAIVRRVEAAARHLARIGGGTGRR